MSSGARSREMIVKGRYPPRLMSLAVAFSIAFTIGPGVDAAPILSPTPAGANWEGLGASGLTEVADLGQAHPRNEAEAQAFSDALEYAENNPVDVGYPWIDPDTGTLELSAASKRGAELLDSERATLEIVTEIRDVALSYAELESLKDDLTKLQADGVSDADLIYQVAPDHRNNRIVITVSRPSDRLFMELAERYGTSAIAIQVDGIGLGGSTAANRQADTEPYYGGAKILGVDANAECTDSFAWVTSGSQGNALLTAAHCAHLGGNIKINGQTVGSVQNIYEENWNQYQGSTYYSGQSVYRGDVALIRLNNGINSLARIYRGGPNSSTNSAVVSAFMRYSQYGDHFYLGGQKTGETGLYSVDAIGIDWWYSDNGPNVWVRNVSRATFIGSGGCMDLGDSGGSIFKTVTGGVKAAGTLSGFAFNHCNILFTDIYRTFLGLPGGVLY